MQFYSDPARENDTYALPDCEVFELTAVEAAALDQDLVYEYTKKHKYRLAGFNSRDRDSMLTAIAEENNIQGGWFYWYCIPGCLPESAPFGPYASADAAIAACREDI